MQEEVVIVSHNLKPRVRAKYLRMRKQQETLQAMMLTEQGRIRSYQMSKMEGKSKQQKESEYLEKLLQFFKSGGIDFSSNFNQKQTPNYNDQNIKFLQNALIVYGVDFMSTVRVIRYFNYFEPQNIEWIDESSCRVMFKNDTIAVKAVNQFKRDKSNMDLQSGTINKEKWYSLTPYIELGIQKNIQVRIATNFDEPKQPRDALRINQNVNNQDNVNDQNNLNNDSQKKADFFKYDHLKKMFKQITRMEMKQNNIYQNEQYKTYPRSRKQSEHRTRGSRHQNWDSRSKRIRKQHREDKNNYSFKKNRRQSFGSEEEEPNYSFQKGGNNHSMFQQDRISRANYSFALDPHMKQQADRMQENLSFDKQEVVRSIAELNLSMLNLSFNKQNVSQIPENERFIIDLTLD